MEIEVKAIEWRTKALSVVVAGGLVLSSSAAWAEACALPEDQTRGVEAMSYTAEDPDFVKERADGIHDYLNDYFANRPLTGDEARGVIAETTMGGGREGQPLGRASTPVESDIRPAGSEPIVNSAGETVVTLSGMKILEFRAAAGDRSPEERWDMFQKRLQKGLSQYKVGPEDVSIKHRNGEPSIYLGSQFLLTVTDADAAANGSNTMDLAEAWASRLRTALGRIDRD
ncbi:MAG: hypothetical protein HUU35_12300 [Armatimonadetes bacterium]|nr:hypothetical protein [Armatimonadota bacterium]